MNDQKWQRFHMGDALGVEPGAAGANDKGKPNGNGHNGNGHNGNGHNGNGRNGKSANGRPRNSKSKRQGEA